MSTTATFKRNVLAGKNLGNPAVLQRVVLMVALAAIAAVVAWVAPSYLNQATAANPAPAATHDVKQAISNATGHIHEVNPGSTAAIKP